MIAHLRGREKTLEPLGWTGRRSEWIALVCFHSGVFTRAQWTQFMDAHPEQVRRGVHALIAQGVAAEETVPGIRGIGRVSRIFSRRIYRALRAEHIRHRRTASTEVLMRRLLSLDYVIGTSRPAMAADRTGKGRGVRGARHRARAPALPALPGSRRRHPALLPPQAARGT